MRRSSRRHGAAFTLIELMIVLALVALIITLAAPSLRDMILVQRLRGIQAQLLTDINFSRSEAISRSAYVRVRFQTTSGADGMSCYVMFTRPDADPTPNCDCTAAEGSRCTDASLREVKTVQIPNTLSVLMQVPSGPTSYTIDPRTGILKPDVPGQSLDDVIVDTFIDAQRKLRVQIGQSARPSECVPSGSTLGGVAC